MIKKIIFEINKINYLFHWNISEAIKIFIIENNEQVNKRMKLLHNYLFSHLITYSLCSQLHFTNNFFFSQIFI